MEWLHSPHFLKMIIEKIYKFHYIPGGYGTIQMQQLQLLIHSKSAEQNPEQMSVLL